MAPLQILLAVCLTFAAMVCAAKTKEIPKKAAAAATNEMLLPWTRKLAYIPGNQVMSGNDVTVTQNLLIRDPAVPPSSLACNGKYEKKTSEAVMAFQKSRKLPVTGVVDGPTSQLLLSLHGKDGVKDTGFTAASKGYKYKIHIPVYTNRSIETKATLFDAKNKVLHTFTVRAHGHRDNDVGNLPWPDFGDGDVGLNQFSSNGATTTGIIEVDLNSPEPDPTLYGPWPINRLVRGIEGNAKFLLPYIRDGQLLHTGNWTTATKAWKPTMPMPNSSGCLHAHPEDVKKIYELLTKIGVVINPNPFSGKNYPYKPQGIMVIEG